MEISLIVRQIIAGIIGLAFIGMGVRTLIKNYRSHTKREQGAGNKK